MNRFLIITTCFAVTIVLSVVVLYPKYQNVDVLLERIEEKKNEQKYQEEYFSDLEDLSKKLKGHEEPLAKIDSTLLSFPDLPSLFSFLEKASSENGLILKSINSAPVPYLEKEPEIKGHYIGFSLSGSYNAFKNFLSALQKNARLIEVDYVKFSSPKEEGEIFSFDVRIKFYSY